MEPIESMEINQLITYIKEMKRRRGFHHTTPQEEFLLFSEEVGELAHEIWEMQKEKKSQDVKPLAFEVVDCLIYLLSIASMFGIEDLESYIQEKEELNTHRFG